MIQGIGVDIVEVARVEKVWSRYGYRFARKILAVRELDHLAVSKRPVRFLAMRFAAKEATSKALGTGFKSGVAPSLIELVHKPSGKPSLQFHGAVADRCQADNICASHISLADEQHYAVACVVLETARA